MKIGESVIIHGDPSRNEDVLVDYMRDGPNTYFNWVITDLCDDDNVPLSESQMKALYDLLRSHYEGD